VAGGQAFRGGGPGGFSDRSGDVYEGCYKIVKSVK